MKKLLSEPQIVAKPREADRLLGQGKTVEEVRKEKTAQRVKSLC